MKMAELHNVSAQDATVGAQQVAQHGPVVKPTGIFILDRSLGGGLPARSLVYFSADARSMSEVFLYQFTQARKTYYFTTSRRPTFIQNDILNTSDVIFDVALDRGIYKITSKLAIPKICGMVPSVDMIKFKVGDGVQIDTSRDIA